jgi:ABC-2 type transport system permease protein
MTFLRTLPAPARVHLVGRIVSALVFSFASGAVVVAVATPLTDARLDAGEWATLAAALVAGAVPFAFLGIALGYLTSPKGALPIANVLYLALAYLGGLWTGPTQLPAAFETISLVLPTRQYADIVTAAALGRPPPLAPWLALAGWTVAFAALAVWAYRRDEGVRYR